MNSDMEQSSPEEFTMKRKGLGRLRDVQKKLKVQSHEPGQDCKCKRLQCFQNISELERNLIIRDFNQMADRNEQNSYLASLITVHTIRRRRSRSDEEYASLHDCSFGFRVRVIREGVAQEVPVCVKAFGAIHGITRSKIEYIQKSLKFMGVSPKDKRGTHSNRPHKIPQVTKAKIDAHIKSFKGRKSHYSLNKSKKIYLPEDLNIKKMFTMFKEKYPNVNIAYETYRQNFKKYKISFGYPRSDTCSACDKYLAEMQALEHSTDSFAESRRKKLTNLNNQHKAKAQTFYAKKRAAKNFSKTDFTFEAIALDYQKNVSLPNVTTNDVYYNRQLSMYSFNIHILSSGKSVFYTYPETVGKKGSNEVISFLYDFVFNILDNRVTTLEIFCDSAGGQNKNQSVFKFIHYLVHYRRRFTSAKITFPIRGHSYLECDKNFGLVNLKTKMEIPVDWYDLLKKSRVKPEPFIVKVVEQNMIRNWSSLLSSIRYVNKLPFKIQELREIEAKIENPRLLFHRSSYNGHIETSIVTTKMKQNERYQLLRPREFFYPDPAYTDPDSDKAPLSPTRRKLPKTPEQIAKERTVSGRIQIQVWYHDERKELVVAVLAADDLAPRDDSLGFGCLTEAYARLCLLPLTIEEHCQQTDVAPASQNPIWNANLSFMNVPGDELMERVLEITLWDLIPHHEHAFLGECSVDLQKAFLDDRAVWCRLEDPRQLRGKSPHTSPRGSVAGTGKRSTFGDQRSVSDDVDSIGECASLLHPDHAWGSRRGSSQSEQLEVEVYELGKDFSRSLPGSRRSSFQSAQEQAEKQEQIAVPPPASYSRDRRRSSCTRMLRDPEEILKSLKAVKGELGRTMSLTADKRRRASATPNRHDNRKNSVMEVVERKEKEKENSPPSSPERASPPRLGPGQIKPRGYRLSGTRPVEIKLGLLMTKGQLEVEVVCARHIPPRDTPPDTYVKCYLKDGERWLQKKKTRVYRHSCEPQFRQTLKYQACDVLGRSLVVMLWERQSGFEHNQGLGGCEITLDSLTLTHLNVGWYPLFPIHSLGSDSNDSP